MASTFELLEQTMAETAAQLRNDPELRGATPQMLLVQKATAVGFDGLRSDLQRLRVLAKSPRLESWLAAMRDRDHRDAGGIAAVVEVLDLLRSMA